MRYQHVDVNKTNHIRRNNQRFVYDVNTLMSIRQIIYEGIVRGLYTMSTR